MEWDRGTRISAVLHAGFIFWALFGDWLFSPSELPDMQTADVSMVSEDEFQALMAAAPKAAEITPPPAVKPPPRPQPPAEPAPEPAPATEPLPQDLPTAETPQPIEAPPPVAPLADEEQPIPVPTTDLEAAPQPSERIAAVPVEDSIDAQALADQVIQETTDQPAPDAEVIEDPQEKASPQEASTQIVTETTDVVKDAPELAPTSSRRPQSRPETPVETAEEETPVTPEQDQVAETDPTDAPPAEEDPIAAALAEASETPEETAGTDENLPEGPKMSASEVEGLRIAVNKCWSVGTLSTEALNTIVQVRVELDQAGKPKVDTFEMLGFEGGGDEAALRVFEAGRRAVIRCAGPGGYDLPPEKYEDWRIVNIEFDPNGMRLR